MRQWQYTPYLIPMLVAVALSVSLSAYAWRRRSVPVAAAFFRLMLAGTVLAVCYSATLANHDPSTKILLAKMQFMSYSCLSLAWLAFAFEYTGSYEWLTPRRLVMLGFVPMATLLLAWSNEVHGLIWHRISFYREGGLTLMNITFGVWFWVHVVCSYSYNLIGTVVIAKAITRSINLYRRQAAALVVAALLPWIGNVLYIFRLGPLPNLDLTPLAFSLTGLAIAWGLIRYHLLDLIPVARDMLVDVMSDGMVVVDIQNRILDINPAMQAALCVEADEVIGKPVSRVFNGCPEIVKYFDAPGQAHTEIRLRRNNSAVYYDMHMTPLSSRRGDSLGRLILIRDITGKKQQEEEREGLIVELREALAQVKQLKTLLPICASCKKIRDDQGYWQEVEVYISKHADILFSHGLCPDCAKKMYRDAFGSI